MKAKGEIDLDGIKGIKSNASAGDISMAGNNIKGNALMQLELTGATTTTVQGGAQLTLKAAMIMIN